LFSYLILFHGSSGFFFGEVLHIKESYGGSDSSHLRLLWLWCYTFSSSKIQGHLVTLMLILIEATKLVAKLDEKEINSLPMLRQVDFIDGVLHAGLPSCWLFYLFC